MLYLNLNLSISINSIIENLNLFDFNTIFHNSYNLY